MSAPEYVPTSLDSQPRRGMRMPPARSWQASRESDIRAEQPTGPGFGSPGPDQGYALRLVPHLRDRLHLAEGEDVHDVEAGCVNVALKRASLFGRAPVIYDLEVAYTIWGYLDPNPDPALSELRRELFQAASHDYWDQREIVDRVPADVLRLSPEYVQRRYEAGWRDLLTTP